MSTLSRLIGLAVTIWCLVYSTAAVRADPPRTRTLTYDSERREWVETPPPPAGTPEGDLHQIRVLNKDGEFGKALSRVKQFVKQYGESDALYPEVVIAKAEAQIGRRDFYKAYGTLTGFLDEFSGMALTEEAIRLEFVIAETYLSGVKRKIGGVRLLSGEDIALRILDDISVTYPNTRYAEYAIKTKADYLFRTGDHALAEMDYARLLREHPSTQYHRYALRRSAESALASFAGIEYDDAALIEAEERYRDYANRYGRVAEQEGVGVILETIAGSAAPARSSLSRSITSEPSI